MNEDRIVTSPELAAELALNQSADFSFKVGFPSLDRILNGVEQGELVIVSGPSDGGKTTLLMSITKNIISQGVNSCWFTLEVTPRQFIKKLSKMGDELPFFYVPRRGFDDVDPTIVKAWEQAHKKQFGRINWIEMKIQEAIGRAKQDGKELKAVFIDHIHQIFSVDNVDRSVSLELGDMVAKLKDIAVKNELAIFLIAHNKDDPQGTMREPRMEDIRDSGLISRLADTILMIWRIPNSDDGTSTRRKELSESDNKSKIKVCKNRREGTKGFLTAWHWNHYLTEEDKERW